MTIQEEAQANIDKDNRELQLSQMKYKLGEKARVEKYLAELVDEIAKIEVAPFPYSNCGSGITISNTNIGGLVGNFRTSF